MSSQIANKVQEELTKNIIAQLGSLNLGLPYNQLKSIAAAVSSGYSTQLVNNITNKSNALLNSIPAGIIGPNNPVDLISSNLSGQDLYDTFSEAVNSEFSASTLNQLVGSLQGELARSLPPDVLAAINLGNIISTLTTGLTTAVETAVSTALEHVTDSLFNNPIPTIPTISGIEGVFDRFINDNNFEFGDVEDALEEIDIKYSDNLIDDALTEADNFNINVPDNQEKLIALEKGFIDPSATYPTKEYAEQQETNKLIRGVIKGTVVEDKNKNRVTGIKLPYDNSFDEPESPFNGEYPYNKVTQTESGHVVEVDDTPGNERLHIYHKSGTYVEIDSNGTVVKRTVGSSYEIIDKNGKIAIRGVADISVNGACNIFVGNDANMEVIGNVNVTCHNDINVQAGGIMNLTAKEEINIHSTNINIEADKDLNILADGEAFFTAKKNLNVTSDSEIKLHSKEDYSVISDKTLNLQSTQDYNVISDSNIKMKSGDNMDLLAGGDINGDATKVYFNTGTATSAAEANRAEEADVSNAGLMDGRKYVDLVSIPDPQPLRFSARVTEKTEGVQPTDQQLRKQEDELVNSGVTTKEELKDPPVAVEEQAPASSQDRFIAPDASLLKVTELPGNYKLSPNVTLDMTWKKVAVSPGKHVLRAQRNLTYGQIVYNLQAVALNVIEPIKKLYPNMLITSWFRHDTEYPVSPHAVGLAVDMQFPGVSKSDYYDIAVKIAKLLKYDQVLLEYWVQAPMPWIHVGLGNSGQVNPGSLRNIAWTFKDHKLYKQSLVNLA